MIEEIIRQMKHSPRHNYVIPGLTSWLIGAPQPDKGCVRLFTMERNHVEPTIPHSHRFDFRCRVLKGNVTNRIWRRSINGLPGDEYQISDVTYEGVLGKHKQFVGEIAKFTFSDTVYTEGKEYGMAAEEYHSIYFSKGAEVLFFEGPNRLPQSQILEPISQGKRVPLFVTEPWMFLKPEEI